jgi:hypothetical protein
VSFQRLQRAWEDQKKLAPKKKPSFVRALFFAFYPTFLAAGVAQVIHGFTTDIYCPS